MFAATLRKGLGGSVIAEPVGALERALNDADSRVRKNAAEPSIRWGGPREGMRASRLLDSERTMG